MATVAERTPVGVMVPTACRVVSREQETADTWTLALAPLAGDTPAIAPGQFMMVTAFGYGEVPISVSALPLVLTVRDVGAVTHAICSAQLGDVLGVRGPFGNAWPIEDAAGGDILVVAGGIGLAPLRGVVLHTLEHRAAFAAVTVCYGARTPGDLLYTAQLEEWRRSIDVDVTVDAADSTWTGRIGVVTKLLAGARFRPERTTAFVCGPEIMMHFVATALLDASVAPERIHLSMERHMDCGVGLCGHCQLGPTLICRDGAVYDYARIRPLMAVREL